MSMDVRVDVASYVQAKLAPFDREVDVQWLARSSEYARELQTLCRIIGGAQMEVCSRLLGDLAEAIRTSDPSPGRRRGDRVASAG